MSRSGGRLNLTGALNRNMPPSHLNPLTSEPSSKQASVCRLERELKAVKEENNRLRHHLEETRSALKEITTEASLDNFDERRVSLLKMQIIQLQRQVLLMSEALGSRSTALMEVENALTWLSEKFRHYIGMDVKGAEVPVLRSDFMTMVDTSESARIKLFKNIENCSKENLSHPQMLMNSFLKPGQDKEFTTLDCCLGRFDCLNLKHVAQLESKLSRLYKELVKVSEYLNSRAGTEPGDKILAGHMSSAVREREGTVILRACAMSRDCAADLLSLSLLFPSTPWPPLKKPRMTEVTYKALAPSLPALSRSKAAEVQRCVTAALKACNHRCHMVSQEAGALREEVRFHQAVYQLQLDYVQQVFDALSKGYSEFEHSTNELLIQPLKKLLEAYRKLKNDTSHEGLREFLTILKEQELQWTDIVHKLDISDPQNQSGSAALSAFGEEFLTSLNQLVQARQTQRDRASSQKDDLKAAQQKLEEELRSLITGREEQHKPAKEIDNKDLAPDVEGGGGDFIEEMSILSHRSSSRMPEPADDAGEGITGLRPWLDDPSIGANGGVDGNSGQKKKGKRSQAGSVTNRKPWQDVGDIVYQDGAGGRSQSQSRNEDKETERELITGLRPWLDDQVTEQEHSSVLEKKTPVREHSDMPISVRQNSDIPLESGSRCSMYDCDSSRSLYPHDGVDSERSERLPHIASVRHPGSSAMAENKFPCHSEEGNLTVKPLPTKPPTDLSSKEKKERSKRPAKPRNYEPKLYVANRTLSLRRSGSLSKLSEPSLQEQMAKMSVSNQQAFEHSRTRRDSNSK